MNVVSAEGDLTRMTPDDVKAITGELAPAWTTQAELEQLLRGPGRGATGFEYWWPVLLAVMLLLIGESVIGMIFERLRR